MLKHRPWAIVALAGAVVAGIAAAPAPASATPWQAPRVARVIGAPSRPLVYAWGLAYNPVADEVWAGDYLNYQIRRFGRDGGYRGSFSQPKEQTGGIPYGIAVDPRDGSVYVAQNGGGAGRNIAKYSVNGVFLWDFNLSGNIGWLAVDSNGYLYANQVFGNAYITYKLAINDANQTATEVQRFGTFGSGPGQSGRITGVAVAADGRVYTSDPLNGVVHEYSPAGPWIRDIGSRGSGAGRFSGDMRGVAVDNASGLLYVADSQAGQIEVFTLDGAPVSTFGSLGSGPGQFADGARGLAVTPDGNLWTADYGNTRVEEFRADGSFVGTFPNPAVEADGAGMSLPRGVAVDRATNDVLVADPWNQRMQRFAPDGSLLSVSGRRGSFAPTGSNYPRSVGVDPATGNVWKVNYENEPFTLIYSRAGTYLSQVKTDRFMIGIAFNAGKSYMADYRYGYVEIRDSATGAYIGRCCTGERLNGVTVDTITGEIYAASADHAKVSIYAADGSYRRSLTLDRGAYGVTIVNDIVYATDVQANKVIAFDRTTGARIGEFGTTGSGAGQLKSPSDIDHDDAGNLYVADANNSRVQVFTFSPPGNDVNPPSAAFSTPLDGSTVSEIPTLLTGTAGDDVSVGLVALSIRDLTTGLYWRGTNSTWTNQYTWNDAPVAGPLTATTWRYSLGGAFPGHAYQASVRATDLSGNVTFGRKVSFSVSAPGG